MSNTKRGRGRPPKGFSEEKPILRLRIDQSVIDAVVEHTQSRGLTRSEWVRSLIIERLEIEKTAA